MNTDTTSHEPTGTTTPTPPRRLVRPVDGRSVAGVAKGLAHYLNLSVGLIRFAFVVAVLFGGMGIVLYLAGWLLIRDESENESIAQRVFDNLGSGPSWLGITLLVLGAVIVLDNFTLMRGSLVWAVVLISVGFLLYRGDIGPRAAAGSGAAAPAVVAGAPSREGSTEERTLSGGGEEPPPPPTGDRPAVPPAPPAPPAPPSILGRLTLGAGLLALGVLAVVDNMTHLVEPQPRHYLALATAVVGLGLLVGAFLGRARWMILLGIFLVPALLVSPATEVNWEGRFQRVVSPADLEGWQSSYRSGAGSYVFDLSQSEWDGQNLSLDVTVAAGSIVIVLPEDVGLTGSARVGIGAIEAPDGDRAGLGEMRRTFSFPGERGTLDVDLDVGAGVVEVYPGSPPEPFGPSWDMRLRPGDVVITERNR